MKNPFKKRSILAAITALALTASSGANPSGPTVKAGQVNISGGSPTLNIEQLTNKAIIDWDRFSIGAAEAVRFLQPSQMAVILNRVTGQDPSQILGSLSANGQVFLINPNGILFGPNAQIDVGGLVASTLGISDEDFLAGRYNFQQDPRKELASIINQGTITVSEGGYAILTAPLVSNEGLVVANLGKVALAGGESTTVNFDGRELINFEVAGLTGGEGTVVLPREAVGGLLADTLGASKRAERLVERADGTVVLERGSGTVVQAGVVRADGKAGSKAGSVHIDSTALTILGSDSITAADGQGLDSEGGDVYALSDLKQGLMVGLTGSLLSAQGGETGDGGFIEFSGSRFSLGSTIDASAEGGFAGTFLLDPRDIMVVSGANAGNPFPLPAAPADSTITDGTLEAIAPTVSSITLQADRDIIFNNTGDNTLDLSGLMDPGVNSEDYGHFIIQAGGNVVFNDDIIIAPAIDILAGLDAVAQMRNGDVTGGTLRTNDLDIGVATTNALAVGTAAAPDVAGRTASPVTGLVNIGFDRLTAPTGTSTSLVEADANTVQQDLTVLANGNITLTDSTAAATLNTRDQIRIERFDREGRAITAAAPTSNDAGIRSTNGNVTLTTTRYVAVGKGASDAIDTGDTGTNSLQADATNAVLSVTAGALQDRSGGLEDVTARDGHVTLTTTLGDLGGDTATGAAIDVSAEAVTARGLINALTGADVGLDVSGVTTQFLDVRVRNSGLWVRDSFGTLGAAAPQISINDGTDTLSGNTRALNISDVGVEHSGPLLIGGDLVVGANNTMIIESTFFNPPGAGSLPGRINDGNGATNNVTLNANSTMGLTSRGDLGTLADPLEFIAPTANGQEATLAASPRQTGAFVEVTGDLIIGTATTTNRALAAPAQARQVVGIPDGDDNRFVATGDIRVVSPIDAGIEGGRLDLVSRTGRIDLEANVSTSFRIVMSAATGIFQVDGNTIATDGNPNLGTLSIGFFTSNGNVGTAANPVDITTNNLSVDVNLGADATAGNAYIVDTAGGLNVVDTVTAVQETVSSAGVPNNADGDLSIVAATTGANNAVLNVNADITTGEDLELRTTGGFLPQNINLAANVDLTVGDGVDNQGDGENAVIDASGNIVQDNTGSITVRNTLGLRTTVGGDAGSAANDLDFNAANLVLDINRDTLQTLQGGDAFLNDPDGVTLVDTVTAVLVAVANGVPNNVDRDLSLTTDEGTIGASGDLNVGRNLDFIANDTNASGDDGDIALGATATFAVTGNATLRSARNITQANGGTFTAAQLGFQTADGSVGTTTDDFDYNAPIVAFNAADGNGDGTGGDVYLDRSGGGIAITAGTSVTSVATTITTMLTLAGDLALEASAGNVDINSDLVVRGDLQLVARDRDGAGAGGNVILGSSAPAPINVTVGNPGAPTAADNNAVFSAVGNVTQVSGGTLLVEDAVAFETVDGNVTDLGAGADQFLSFNAVSLALDVNDGNGDETGGDVFLEDQDGGVALVDTVTAVNEAVSSAGVANNVDNDLVLRSREGTLAINAGLNVGEDLELRANDTNGSGDDGDIALGMVNISVGTPAVPTAANNDAVLRAARNITQTQGGLVTVEDTLGVSGAAVGSQANDLDINATGVVVGATSAFIDDSAGGLATVQTVTARFETVTQSNPVQTLFLESSGGDLQISSGLNVGANAVLTAIDTDGAGTGGRLVIGNEGGGTGSNIAGFAANIILGAATDIVNVDDSAVSANNLGIETVDGSVGTLASFLPITALTGLSLDVNDGNGDETGGDAFLTSTSNAVTVIDSVTSLGRTVSPVGTPNNVDNDLALTSTAGSVTINADLNVGEDLDLLATAANADVALGTGVDVNVGRNAALVANRSVTQVNGGTLNVTGDLGLETTNGDVGSGADSFDFNSASLAVNAPGRDAFLNDTGGGVIVTDQVTGVVRTVTGNRANNLRVATTGGDLTVNAAANGITTTNDLDLVSATGNVVLTAGAVNGVNIVLSAGQGITQTAGTVAATSLGLNAGADIGSAGDAFDFNSTNLAVNVPGNDGFLNDTAGGVTVVNTVTGVTEMVTGNNADNLRLVATGGNLTVNATNGITTTNDLDLVSTTGNVALTAGALGGVNIVLSAGQSITQTAGTVAATSLGLNSGADIGSAADPFDFNSTNVAVNVPGNDGFLNDTAGGVTVVDSVTGVTEVVTGNSASNLRIVATGGNLGVNAAANGITTTNDLDLVSTTGSVDLTAGAVSGVNVVLSAGGGITQAAGTLAATSLGLNAGGDIGSAGDAFDFNSTSVAVNVPGNDGFLNDTAGGVTVVNQVTGVTAVVNGNNADNLRLVATGGDLDVNATNGITTTNDLDLVSTTGNVALTAGALNGVNIVLSAGQNITQTAGTVTATSLGLGAGGDIGNAGDAFDFNSTNLTVNATGDANVSDSNGGVTLVDTVTGVTQTVTNNRATNLQVTAVDDVLNVNAPGGVAATNNLDLNGQNIVLTQGAVTAVNAVFTATQSITQTGGTVATTSLGLVAVNGIGTGADPLDFNTTNLAVRVPAGDVFLNDTAGGVTVVDQVTGVAAAAVGNTASNLRLVATGGPLAVNAAANGITTTNDLDLVSTTGNVDLTAGAVSGVNVVLSAGQSITQTGGTLAATSLGLNAGGAVGSGADPFDFNTTNLSVNLPGNDGFLNDTAGGVTVVDTVTGVTETVTGNNASNLRVVATGGDLTVNAGTNGVSTTNDLDLVSTTGNVVLTAGAVSGVNVVLSAGQSITQTAGTVAATSLGLNSGANIGSAADPFDFNSTNVAVNVPGNDGFLNDTAGGVTIVDTVTGVTQMVTGNNADNLRVVATGGPLAVNAVANGIATTNDLDLVSTTGNVDLTAGAISGVNIVVNAGQAITQAAATITGTSVGLMAGTDIGAAANPVDINATNAVVRAGGSARVRDLDGGLTLVNTVTGVTETTTENRTGAGMRVEAADTNGNNDGALTIAADVSVGTNADFVAEDDVNLNAAVVSRDGANGTIIVRADSDNDENGGINGVGNIAAVGLGLAAGENIGTPGGAPLMVNVTNLVVDTDSDMDNMGGSVNVQDTAGGVTIAANLTGLDETVSGARSAGSLQIEAADPGNAGVLTLNADATAQTGIDLLAEDSVNLNANVTSATGNLVVTGDSDGDESGAVTQTNGNLISGNQVGLSAGRNIGTPGGDALDVMANQLTVRSTSGGVNVRDTDGGLTLVGTVTSVARTVTNNAAGTSFEVEAADANNNGDGALTVAADVNAGTGAELLAEDDVNLNANLTAADNAVVVADNDGDGMGDVTQPNGSQITATGVGLSGVNIGAVADPLDVLVTNLTVNATGDAHLTDGAGGVTLVNTVTGVNQAVTNNRANNLRVVATGGDLTVNAAGGVTTTNDVDLVAGQNVVLTQGAITAVNGVLSAGQGITRTGGTIATTSLGLNAGANIATAGTPLTFDTTNLAVNVPGNDGFLNDTAGGVTVVNQVTGVTEMVNGNNASNLRLVATGGPLTVNATNGVTTTNDLDLVSTTGSVNLTTGAVNGVNVVLSAGQQITQGTGTLNATSVGLNANEIGAAADPLDINTANLTVRTVGNARVRDLDGGLNVVDSVTGVTETVTGNQTGQGLRLEAADANNNGDGVLNINADVTIGAGGSLLAEDNVNLNRTVTATGNLVVHADRDDDGSGAITQTNGQTVNAAGLGLRSSGGIGTGGDAFDINATNLTVRATGAGADVKIRDGAGGLTIVETVGGLDETVTTNTVNRNLQVMAFNGALTIDAAIESVTGSMDLMADGNAPGNCTVVINSVITAAAGNVVIVAAVDITDPTNAGLIVTNQVGLQAGNDAGVQAAPLDVRATDLSFNGGRDVFVEDTTGGINVVNSVTGAAATVNGPTSGRDARVVANNGNLNLTTGATIGRDGELVTIGAGDVILDQVYDAQNGDVVIRTAGNILNPNGNGLIRAAGLGLDAQGGVMGTAAQPIRMEVNTLTRAQTSNTFVFDANGFTQIPTITAIQETVVQPFPILPPVVTPTSTNLIFGSEFAQNNTYLIEQMIGDVDAANWDNVLNEVAQEVVDDDDFGLAKR